MNWYQNLKKQTSPQPQPTTVAQHVARVVVKPRAASQRFVIIPRGLHAPSPQTACMLTSLPLHQTFRKSLGNRAVAMDIVDSIHEDGPKLVQMTPESAKVLQAVEPGLLVVPEVFYQPAVQVIRPMNKPGVSVVAVAKKARAGRRVRKAARRAAPARMVIRVLDEAGNPIADAAVIAFSDFANSAGVDGVTNARGEFSFSTREFAAIDRLYVFPRLNHWSVMRRNVRLAPVLVIHPQPLALDYTDCVRHFFGGGKTNDGAKVRVAVVDSGVDTNHPDLVVAGGMCTIPGEDPASYGPVGGEHGTHVAGIIAARGTPPTGIRGVAPGVDLYSYRVFNPNQGASNFSIIRAIDAAVQSSCDLINMSLSGGPRDPATEAAIDDARRAGCVCIVAAGNDYRSPVGQPAAYSQCVAVSACGRKGTFPNGTADAGDVAAPYGTDRNDFLAAFSNIGPEIDVTGPGVAVISPVPGGHASMSGTSMATPAVTGLCARLLGRAENSAVLTGARDLGRADAIVRLLYSSCVPLGFGYNEEGHGMPRP